VLRPPPTPLQDRRGLSLAVFHRSCPVAKCLATGQRILYVSRTKGCSRAFVRSFASLTCWPTRYDRHTQKPGNTLPTAPALTEHDEKFFSLTSFWVVANWFKRRPTKSFSGLGRNLSAQPKSGYRVDRGGDEIRVADSCPEFLCPSARITAVNEPAKEPQLLPNIVPIASNVLF
jgi:hypothetical protein